MQTPPPEFFSKIVTALPGLLFVKDDNYKFCYVNQPFANLFERKPQDLVGLQDSDIIGDTEQVSHFRNHDRTVILLKLSQTITEEYLTCPNKQTRRLATTKVPLIFEGKTYILGTSVDITDLPSDRLRTIDTLRLSIISELAHIIRTPTARASFELQHMRKDIERYRSRRSKDAHIGLSTESLLLSIQLVSSALDAINISGRNFAAIAHSLRSGQLLQEPEVRNLGHLFQDIVNELKVALLVGNLKPFLDPKCESVLVSITPSDLSLVRTAVYNIVHNAFKFSRSDTTVNFRLEEQSGTPVLTVEDSGCGIDAADLVRIFEPGFSRRAPSHSPGTGMGLTIAKETFDRVGWDIQVSSRANVGTKVTIWIKRHTV